MYLESDYKECKYCNNKFISSHKHRIYCSDDCFNEAIKQRNRDKSSERYKQRCTCRHCGEQVSPNGLYRAQCCTKDTCIEAEKLRRRRLSKKRSYNKYHKKRNKKRDAEASRQYRRNNASKVNAKDRFRKKTKREFVNQYKKEKTCQKCGDKRWFCLDFHHLNGKEKRFNISACIRSGYGIETIKAEIDKCIVLCSNCHRHLNYLEKNVPGWKFSREWLDEDYDQEALLERDA